MAFDWSSPASAATAMGSSADALAGGMTQGLDLGQRMASVHALQGIDLNDPSSVDAGIRGSIRAANLDQAKALMDVNVRRAVISALPGLTHALAGLNGSSEPQAAQPDAGQAQPDQQPGQYGLTPDQMAQHTAIMQEARGAVTKLQGLPVDQRGAAAEQIKQQFLAHGVPEPAIDSALSDLSDPGLEKAGNYFDGVMGATGQPGQTAPQMPAHPSGYAWAKNLMSNPGLLAQINLMKGFGIDMTGLASEAGSLVGPEVAKQAELQYAPQIAAATLPVKLAESAGNKAIESQYAGPIAAATAAGSKAGQAPGTIVTVDVGGQKMEGTFTPGPDGAYAFHPIQAAQGAPTSGGAAHPAAHLGVSAGPAEQAQQTQAAEYLKPDKAAVDSANAEIANSQRLLGLADQIKLGPGAKLAGAAANIGRMINLPGANQYASDIAAMESALKSGSLEQLHGQFPGRITNTDLKYGEQAFGGLSSPNDQVKFLAGMRMASAQRELDFENFKANYDGPKDNPQQIQKAWLDSEGGKSIFAMPTWSNVKIGGKPFIANVSEHGHTETVMRLGPYHYVTVQ